MTTGELLLYTDTDGLARVQVRLQDGSLWLSQGQMAELYGTTLQNINKHVRTIYGEGEHDPAATCRDYLQVQTEGARTVSRAVKHYSLPLILAVGFRVRSPTGTRFRQWATGVLSDYAVKGFALDDRRLKSASDDLYFEELLAKIRDIRSSERVFYRKVLDIYATSIDYDASDEASTRFFQTVQNKMHWAAHGHTAAEIIAARADADAPNMGLTSWTGPAIRKTDVAVAKNYLNPDELEALNRIVSAYLDLAELQAMNRPPMTMAAWIAKPDDCLRRSEREVLAHVGKLSAESAKAVAERAYEGWRERRLREPTPVDAHFEAAIADTKALAKRRPRTRTS